jgi:MFS family permease
LWFVCLFNYADRQAIFSVFPLLKAEMRLSDVQLGYVASSFMWVYAASAPFAGMVGDRFRRKHVILGGLIFWSLITVATALSTRYWHLVAFRALEGLGEAFYFPASMSLISAWHGRETRSRAMSVAPIQRLRGHHHGRSGSGIPGAALRVAPGFYVFGSLGVVLGIVLMFLLKEPETVSVREESFRFSGAWLEVFRNPMAVALMAVFVCANFVAMVFLTWLPSYLTRTFHMSLTMAGFSATAYLQAASVLGVLTGGMVADGWVRKDRRGRMWTQAVGLFAGCPFCCSQGGPSA